jgi:hypothetical protein
MPHQAPPSVFFALGTFPKLSLNKGFVRSPRPLSFPEAHHGNRRRKIKQQGKMSIKKEPF